ncbi:hypothetical protein HMPREF9260_01186, partial [Facklamia hominis ACS-120-V-Sch10]
QRELQFGTNFVLSERRELHFGTILVLSGQ